MGKTGRPLKFKTSKELQTAIDKYFEGCGDKLVTDDEGNAITDKSGNPVFIPNPPTIAGLALALGFEDRQSIYDYKDRPEFSCVIKKAITRIEDYAEKHLYIGRATGAIFWLKNHKWTDKTEIDAKVGTYSLFEEAVKEKAKKYDTVKRSKKTVKKQSRRIS